MSDLSNDTKKHTTKSRETIPLKKVLSATPRYATQCEIQFKNFLVESALCGTAGSRLRAMPHSAKSIFVVEFNRISPRIRIYSICKTVLAHESGDPGVQFNEKNRGSQISWHCPFKNGWCWWWFSYSLNRIICAGFVRQKKLKHMPPFT
jgi:hypothetical protein